MAGRTGVTVSAGVVLGAALPGVAVGRVVAYSSAAETPAAWSSGEAVSELFATHYRPLVRLAALLVHDPGLAEELTQDAFVALHQHWRRLREPDKAVAYLRQSVVNRARSALRRRSVADRFLRRQSIVTTAASAEATALQAAQFAEILAALRVLPARQRETVILRYYAELSEAEIAEAMGVSRGAVKSHMSRALAALRRTMEPPA